MRWAHSPSSSLARRAVLRVELKHGQEFHGGDAQIFEVGIFWISPAYVPRLWSDALTGMASEPSHVKLVDHGLRKGPVERQNRPPNHSGRDRLRRFSWPRPHCHRGRAAAQRSYLSGTATGETVRVEETFSASNEIHVPVRRAREPDRHIPGLAAGLAQRHASSDGCGVHRL